MTFDDFDFNYDLLDGLDAMGFFQPTPIQQEAIPLILEGRDLIGCAQTGTGKTAAFLLPILNKLSDDPSENTDTLIVVPTRELAIQIDQALQGFSYYTGVSSALIYGGGDGIDFEKEKKALKHGANIIIATPGRLMSHLNMDNVKFQSLKHLILDEADRMLNMGFIDDILKIITFLPTDRQTILFSATMPPKIRDLAKKILINPAEINLALSKPAEGVTQSAYLIYEANKQQLAEIILKDTKYKCVIVFASTKQKVKELERDLRRLKVHAKSIHSDLEQTERETVMLDFKNKKLPVLVATDIVSRGIDIDDIDLVINYDVPRDAEDYVHRVGRTARADSKGEAITFISERDHHAFSQIEKLIGYSVEKKDLPPNIPKGPDYAPGIKNQGGNSKGKKNWNRKKR